MPINEVYSDLIFVAGNDLESAKILANYYKPQIEISCYHCQQCAEKALKSFLAYHFVKFQFIHNLEELCEDCKSIDNSFSTLFPECKSLNDYITKTRYSSKCNLTETNMKQAIKHAEKILNFVKEKTRECQ